MRKWSSLIILAVYLAAGLVMATFLIPATGWKALTVLTGSMRPKYQPGTLVLVHTIKPEELRVGQIITYANPAKQSETITHRIVRLSSDHNLLRVTTKGDANKVADMPFAAGRVIGRVYGYVPVLGKFTLWSRQPLALALLVIIPGFIIIIAEMKRLNTALSQVTVVKDQTVAAIKVATRTISRPVRVSLDGISKVSILLLIPVIFAIAKTSTTHSKLKSTVSLTGNTISTRVTPIGSTTSTTITETNTTTITNNTNVTINNKTTQTGKSGSATLSNNTQTGSTSTGKSSNTITTKTEIDVSNY